jgi:hypothetical protein
VLYIVIPAACLGLALFGLILCHLSARSDASDALALAEWIATSQLSGEIVVPPATAARREDHAARRRYEPSEQAYRATG